MLPLGPTRLPAPTPERGTLRRVRKSAMLLVGALAVLASTVVPSAPARPIATLTVLDVGDSLSIGTAPYLDRSLRSFRIVERHDVGLHAGDAAAVVARRRTSLPPVIVVSAGTNDDPRLVSTFARSVSRIVAAAGRRRCVVWPTIVRPPAVGRTYAGFNSALAREARRNHNLVLVDWVEMVRNHPWWLSADGVHVGAAGYRARAAAIAEAVTTRCTGTSGRRTRPASTVRRRSATF